MRSSVCCFLPQSSSCQAHLEFSLHFLKGPSESQSCQEQAYSRLHNPTAGCWSSSRAQMLGQRQGRQLCEPTGLARPPRSSPQRGKWELQPTWLLQDIERSSWEGPGVYTFDTEQCRTGFWWREVHSGVQVSSATH